MTLAINPNSPVDPIKPETTDSTSPLNEVSKGIPTLIPKANGLGSTHHVTNDPMAESELKLKQAFERAKRDAAQNGKKTSQYIKNYGIKDQNMLFEIAKIAAAQNNSEISAYIENYGITDQNMLFEVAKIDAAQNNSQISAYIENYGITDQNMLFEIAKIDAAQNNSQISKWIHYYGIKDQNMLFEIAKINAAQDSLGTVEGIHHYKISQKQQRQVLQICFAQIINIVIETGNYSTLKDLAYNSKCRYKKKIFATLFQMREIEIPLHFEKAEHKKMVETDLKNAFNQLKDFALKFGARDTVLASLEKTIFTKHTSLQQQRNDLLWLCALVLYYSNDLSQSPFCDEEMFPLLDCIANTIDSTLRNRATTALFASYKDPEKMMSLKTLMTELKDERLYLIVLFSTLAGIETKITKKICDELPKAKYKDAKLMAPINELMGALYKSSSLSPEEKQRLLGLIFNPPVKGDRESKPDFNLRLDQYRKNRQTWITAVLSLLYFGQEKILKNITNSTELVEEWQTFMRKAFYIRDDVADKFIPTFVQSKRYPNGLIIYTTCLQTLPKIERDLLLPLLGKFANSVLDGTFPQIRYSFTNNPHLEAVFSGNEELLNKWQTSLPIKIENTAIESLGDKTPLQQVQKLMRDALENHHLGTDQNAKFPELKEILAGNFKDSDEDIVRYCTMVLNPKTNVPELKAALIELQKLFPSADVQFHHDLKDMMAKLETPASSVPFTIEDTDAWEDIELMGTEVDGSCQNINRGPGLNKCLLASLLDGKIRLMVAREKGSGKIIGRVVLRVLLDENKKPVLFVETLYTRNGANEQLIRQSILEGCKQKAQSMGIALAASAGDYHDLNANEYPGALKSLGGPAPYEYVDALSGLQNGGIYSIPKSYLLWSPSI